MKKSEKIVVPALGEETELDLEELDNVTGGAHPGGANQDFLATNSKLCDGSVKPAEGTSQILIGLLRTR